MKEGSAKDAAVIVSIAAVNIIVFVLAEIFVGSTMNPDVLGRAGGAVPSLIGSGEYWRLFTSMFLHAGIRHLLDNMLILFVTGCVAEPLLGHAKILIGYLLCGLAGNVVNHIFSLRSGTEAVTVGASGAVFGVIGMLLWIVIRNKGRIGTYSAGRMIFLLFASLYLGFASAGVANEAHVGGAVSGFLYAMIVYRKRSDSRKENVKAETETEQEEESGGKEIIKTEKETEDIFYTQKNKEE